MAFKQKTHALGFDRFIGNLSGVQNIYSYLSESAFRERQFALIFCLLKSGRAAER